MGFECGFERVKKYNTDFSVSDFFLVDTYLTWRDNPWNFKNMFTKTGEQEMEDTAPYPTFEKYWNSHCEWVGKYPGEPSLDEIEFYSAIKNKNQKKEPYASTSETIDFWCSNGRYIDDEIVSNLEKINEYTYGPVNDDFIEKMFKWVEGELKECKLVQSLVLECFQKNEDGTKLLIPCDGIVATNPETGDKRFIDTSEEEFGEYIYIPSKYFDEDKFNALNQFKETLFKLSAINQDDELVWYERSF